MDIIPWNGGQVWVTKGGNPPTHTHPHSHGNDMFVILHWLKFEFCLQLLCVGETSIVWRWGSLNQFHPFCYFPTFQNYQNTSYLLNIMLTFNTWNHSSAASTRVKHWCDSKDLTETWIKMSLREKLMNTTSVTPTLMNLFDTSNVIRTVNVSWFK